MSLAKELLNQLANDPEFWVISCRQSYGDSYEEKVRLKATLVGVLPLFLRQAPTESALALPENQRPPSEPLPLEQYHTIADILIDNIWHQAAVNAHDEPNMSGEGSAH